MSLLWMWSPILYLDKAWAVQRWRKTSRAGSTGTSVTFWNPDYDKECSPALVKIARDAGQEVPPFLAKFERAKANKQWKVADAAKAAEVLLASEAEDPPPERRN